MIIRARVLILLQFAQMTENVLCSVNCNGEMILIEQGTISYNKWNKSSERFSNLIWMYFK
jgi:hypothetical protein